MKISSTRYKMLDINTRIRTPEGHLKICDLEKRKPIAAFCVEESDIASAESNIMIPFNENLIKGYNQSKVQMELIKLTFRPNANLDTEIILTPDQKLYVDFKGWTKAIEITDKDKVVGYHGLYTLINHQEKGKGFVGELIVNNNLPFYAENILVKS